MVHDFTKSTMRGLAAALNCFDWEADVDGAGGEVQARKSASPSTDHVISFATIYSKRDAVCYQVGVGIRLHDVNRILGELRDSDARHLLTAYSLVNHLAPQSARRTGWCFRPASDEELFRVANLVVREVLEIAEVQALFSSIVDIDSYIAAVEQALWPFVSVQEPYIAALISVGRTADAMRAASEAERDYLAAVAARGAAVRESDLAFVRRVQGLSH
jgi:hypothetical protein